MKILIVEDSEEMLFVLKEIINPALDVTFATDFNEAKAFLEVHTPDLVITDWNFPYGNGDDVARLARAKGCKRIILHSGSVKYEANLYDDTIEKLNTHKILQVLKFS